MTQEELRAIVEHVGDQFKLGEYEIDAYLAILEHGELTASEIADHSDIPQPRVYDTVRSLSDRELVELRESRPMKVAAIRPKTAFDEVKHSLEEMIDELEARYTAPSADTEAVSLVKSRTTILRYLEDVIDSAEYELLLSLTPGLLERYETELKRATRQGVSVDLLLTPGEDISDEEAFDFSAIANEVRSRRGITTPIIAVADGTYSIYATQDAIRDDRDRYGVIFNRSALGFLVSGFFGTVLWTTATNLYERDVDTRSYPRRYASIRRCVKDLMDMSGEFYATIDGRDVETGDSRIVKGRIVEVSFEPTEEIAGLTIYTTDGEVTVGGRVASLEDVEAHEIRIGKYEPPPLE